MSARILFLDIVWLAGLLEGEGCFGFSGSKVGSARVALAMTDNDVVGRAAKLLNSKINHRVRGGQYKDVFATAVYGSQAAGWMMTLYSLMGQRRRETIKTSLTRWRKQRQKNPQGTGRRNPRGPWEALPRVA